MNEKSRKSISNAACFEPSMFYFACAGQMRRAALEWRRAINPAQVMMVNFQLISHYFCLSRHMHDHQMLDVVSNVRK